MVVRLLGWSDALWGFLHPPNAWAAEGREGTVVKVSSLNQHGGFGSTTFLCPNHQSFFLESQAITSHPRWHSLCGSRTQVSNQILQALGLPLLSPPQVCFTLCLFEVFCDTPCHGSCKDTQVSQMEWRREVYEMQPFAAPPSGLFL